MYWVDSHNWRIAKRSSEWITPLSLDGIECCVLNLSRFGLVARVSEAWKSTVCASAVAVVTQAWKSVREFRKCIIYRLPSSLISHPLHSGFFLRKKEENIILGFISEVLISVHTTSFISSRAFSEFRVVFSRA